MKRFTTDHILMLGMALTSDHRAMERRVRGVFARKKSAKATLLLLPVRPSAVSPNARAT